MWCTKWKGSGTSGWRSSILRPWQCLLCGTLACFSGNLLLASCDLKALGQVPLPNKRVSAPNLPDAPQKSICINNVDLEWLLTWKNLEPGKLGSYASDIATKWYVQQRVTWTIFRYITWSGHRKWVPLKGYAFPDLGVLSAWEQVI